MTTTVFVSDAIAEERIPFGAGPPAAAAVPGRARWAALSARYREGLAALGLAVARVQRPEIYGAEAARALLGVRPGDWHLAVKPLAHLRPFHGLPNVFVLDWPYGEPPGPGGVPPFPDALRLLRAADAVACTGAAAARRLRAAGLAHAVHLPPYLPAHEAGAGDPSPGRAVDGGARVLAAFTEDPSPRDLAPLVEGAAMARARRGDLRLTIAVPGDGRGADRFAPPHGPPPGVAFADAAGLPGLLGAADVFLSTAAPGAPSLPLVGAMLAGVPVVAPVAEEGDLPGADAAVPLAAPPTEVDAEEEPLARHLRLTLRRPTAGAVRDALLAAAGLDAARRARLAAAGRRAAAERHGLAAFAAGLREVAARLGTRAP